MELTLSYFMTHHELSKSQEVHEADPGDFCYCSWVYKSQQTAFDVSDIDLETTAGFRLLKDVKICKGIPTASTYLNSAPWHPNRKPPPKLLTKIRTTRCTNLVQTTNPLRSYLQRSEQHSAHIWCKPKTPFEVTYKDQKNVVHTSIYRL
jgi:hypothetical protein